MIFNMNDIVGIVMHVSPRGGYDVFISGAHVYFLVVHFIFEHFALAIDVDRKVSVVVHAIVLVCCKTNAQYNKRAK